MISKLARALDVPRQHVVRALYGLAVGIPIAALMGWTVAMLQLPDQPPSQSFVAPLRTATAPSPQLTPAAEDARAAPEPARTRTVEPPQLLLPFPTPVARTEPLSTAAEPSEEPELAETGTAGPTTQAPVSSSEQVPTPTPGTSPAPSGALPTPLGAPVPGPSDDH